MQRILAAKSRRKVEYQRALIHPLYIADKRLYDARLFQWRGGREAEGAPLLREYRVYSPIGGSNPPLSATQ